MPDHFYVYPAYVLNSSSRALGRRIPRPQAIEAVTIDEIVRAATALGYSAVPEPEKNYPRQAHAYQGRVKITKRKGVAKGPFLLALAAELRRSIATPKRP